MVACLYQEFVSQNSIIRPIFVAVVSDLPSFPVAVKCILKSWGVKRGKQVNNHYYKQFSEGERIVMLFQLWIRMKIIDLVPPKSGAPHCQCVGSVSCMSSTLPKKGRASKKMQGRSPRSPQVVQTCTVELGRCRCFVNWQKWLPVKGS